MEILNTGYDCNSFVEGSIDRSFDRAPGAGRLVTSPSSSSDDGGFDRAPGAGRSSRKGGGYRGGFDRAPGAGRSSRKGGGYRGVFDRAPGAGRLVTSPSSSDDGGFYERSSPSSRDSRMVASPGGDSTYFSDGASSRYSVTGSPSSPATLSDFSAGRVDSVVFPEETPEWLLKPVAQSWSPFIPEVVSVIKPKPIKPEEETGRKAGERVAVKPKARPKPVVVLTANLMPKRGNFEITGAYPADIRDDYGLPFGRKGEHRLNIYNMSQFVVGFFDGYCEGISDENRIKSLCVHLAAQAVHFQAKIGKGKKNGYTMLSSKSLRLAEKAKDYAECHYFRAAGISKNGGYYRMLVTAHSHEPIELRLEVNARRVYALGATRHLDYTRVFCSHDADEGLVGKELVIADGAAPTVGEVARAIFDFHLIGTYDSLSGKGAPRLKIEAVRYGEELYSRRHYVPLDEKVDITVLETELAPFVGKGKRFINYNVAMRGFLESRKSVEIILDGLRNKRGMQTGKLKEELTIENVKDFSNLYEYLSGN